MTYVCSQGPRPRVCVCIQQALSPQGPLPRLLLLHLSSPPIPTAGNFFTLPGMPPQLPKTPRWDPPNIQLTGEGPDPENSVGSGR